MNTAYHVNKLIGICFAVGLSAFGLHRAYVWREEMSPKARVTLKERLEEMSKDPRYQLPVSDFKLPESPFTIQDLSGINGGTFPQQQQ
jgi:hypothetical protein